MSADGDFVRECRGLVADLSAAVEGDDTSPSDIVAAFVEAAALAQSADADRIAWLWGTY